MQNRPSNAGGVRSNTGGVSGDAGEVPGNAGGVPSNAGGVPERLESAPSYVGDRLSRLFCQTRDLFGGQCAVKDGDLIEAAFPIGVAVAAAAEEKLPRIG